MGFCLNEHDMCHLLSLNVPLNPSHAVVSSVLNLRVMELDRLMYVTLEIIPHSCVICDSSHTPTPDVKIEE